jgi:hypothetical protein
LTFYTLAVLIVFNESNTMKKILIAGLIFAGYHSFSQTYLDKIVQESCNCVSKVSQTLDNEQYTQELGICMIVAAEPYRKQLKKDHNIDFDKIDVDGEKLGKLIGIKMAAVCPDLILAVAKRSGNSESASVESKSFEGTITKIENDFFVVLHIKDDSGKTNKFYWLTYVESGMEVADRYDSMVGSSIALTYRSEEFFDPKIKEYRSFSIIEKLELTSK